MAYFLLFSFSSSPFFPQKEILVTLEMLNHFVVASTSSQLKLLTNTDGFVLKLFKLINSKYILIATQAVWILSNIALDGACQKHYLIEIGAIDFITKVLYSM